MRVVVVMELVSEEKEREPKESSRQRVIDVEVAQVAAPKGLSCKCGRSEAVLWLRPAGNVVRFVLTGARVRP
jgi:hypothetical protein